MKLIFLPKGSQGFSQGSVFPIMEIPLTEEGSEKVDLNDFQWWAPTDKWQQWLKKNPRNWKAESENYPDLTSDKIFEFFSSKGNSVISFDEFYSILEKDENEGGISKEEASKKYTKFIFAYNKLTAENKIILNLNLDKLPKNQKYAFFLDLAGEGGEDVPETRNAYEIKIIQTAENAKFLLAEIGETALTGEIKADEPIGTTFMSVARVVTQAALGGAIVLATVGMGVKVATSVSGRIGLTKTLSSLLPGMAKTGTSGSKSLGLLSNVFSRAKYYTKTLGGSIPFVKGTSQALKAGFKAGDAIKWGSMAVGDARLAAGLARSTNPVGWIISGVMAAQQTYNWLSDKQAPRLGEIEDAGIDAQDSFSPGSIPPGQSITICWTQEAGQGGILSAIGNALVTNDTRTTMDVVKLGNFNGKAFFYLVDIHSESYKKILNENSMILLAFKQGDKFERGYFDNDDLEFELISIKDGSSLSATTYFQGYCGWDEFKQTYDKSDDKAIEVSDNAPDEYSFHFKYGKNDNIINVTGKLVKDLGSAEQVKTSLLPSPGETEKSNESYSSDFSSDVLSFSDFSNNRTNYKILEAEEVLASEAANVQYTETQKIAPYTVDKIEYADKSLEDQELPDLLTFIVPNQYLDSENNSPIKIDPIQEVTIKSPKRGTIIIETDEAPEPIAVGEVGLTGSDENEIEGGVPVEITKDEVKIKYQDNPDILNSIGIPDVTKIKDKDKDDKIKFLDMITPEEKKDLDIEDWDYIKKVKIYKDGKTGDPILIKFRSGGITGDRKRKIKAEDPNFDTALRVAERIQSGFKGTSNEEDEEKA